MRWIAVVAVVVLLWAQPAHAQPAQDEAAGATQPPPVGGLFGLFGRSQAKHTPSPREEGEQGEGIRPVTAVVLGRGGLGQDVVGDEDAVQPQLLRARRQ